VLIRYAFGLSEAAPQRSPNQYRIVTESLPNRYRIPASFKENDNCEEINDSLIFLEVG